MHVLKPDSLVCQFVEMRRLALRMPETTQRRIQVIRHEEENIGFVRS